MVYTPREVRANKGRRSDFTVHAQVIPGTFIARGGEAAGMGRWIAQHRIVRRIIGCMSVSVATTCLSVSILVVLAFGFGVAAGVANFVGVACGIPPSYS